MRGPVPGSDSQFLPAFLPPPFHPGFLPSFPPSFQSVELLSRQVRSRSRSRGRLRKTSVALKGVLLAMMLAEEISLPIAARRGSGSAPLGPGLPSWAGSRGRREWGGGGKARVGGVSCRILPGVWPMPVQVLSTQRTALAPQAPPGVEKQIRTGGGGGRSGGSLREGTRDENRKCLHQLISPH